MENKSKKFSLSLGSKSSRKPNYLAQASKTFANNEASGNDESATHQYVTEFDSSDKTLDLGESSDANVRKLVIPPKENEFRSPKRMKNLDLPLHSSSGAQELVFDVESSAQGSGEDPGVNMSYGLNLRRSGKVDGVGDMGSSGDRRPSDPIDSVLLKKLKDDMNRLPDDAGFEQFEEVPVGGFGAALMAGYGWKEGMGIGRNAKGDVKVVECKRRAAREGIGVFSDCQLGNDSKLDEDAGSKREKGGGRTDKNEKSLGYSVGKEVRIISGRDEGLKGRVVEVLTGNGSKLVLELSTSRERVKVRVSEVAELGSVKEERCSRKLNIPVSRDDAGRGDGEGKDSFLHRSHKGRKGSKRRQEERRNNDSGRVKSDTIKKVEERGRGFPWLRSHIKVRIISKEFKGGKLYLKKGEVVDVVGPTTCDISMDNSKEIIQGVDQDILETALPKRGGCVLVLFGKHKDAFGSLVERNSERGSGIIQNADTLELLNVKLDQIAEYVGDPSDLEY